MTQQTTTQHSFAGVPEFLFALFEGATHANAMMPWDRPGPIVLPETPAKRAALFGRHWSDRPGEVLTEAHDEPQEWIRVERVELAAFCPRPEGRTSWIALDLDATDHGENGLACPAAAGRAFRAATKLHGFDGGELGAESRGGHGRHYWLLLPEPVPLQVAGIALAELVADAMTADPEAFRNGTGAAAEITPGQIEAYPRRGIPPRLGWPLTAPSKARLICEPRDAGVADPENWSAFIRDRVEPRIAELQAAHARRRRPTRRPTRRRQGHRYDLGAVRQDRGRLVAALEDAGAVILGDKVRCPFHDDRNPSGSIYRGRTGTWRFACFASCQIQGADVVEVLRRTGLSFVDACHRLELTPPAERRR